MLLTLMTWAVDTVWAGPRLIIEHPRYPFQQKDVYTVNCDQECVVTISSDDPFSGSTKENLLRDKIRSLLSRMEKKEFPLFPDSPRRLYDITVEEGPKKQTLKVAYPKSYLGADYDKFNALVEAIEEIKFIMRKSEIKR